jgi:uncharacterized membrane protein
MTAAVASMDRSQASRWLAIGLLASLSLNLVVIGATASLVWRHWFEREAAIASQPTPNLLGYVSTLSPERRKEIESRTEEQWRVVRPLRRALREARDESLKAMGAENFDRQGYAAAQARMLEVGQHARKAVYGLYGETAVNLTPEERRGFLAWREQRRPKQNLLDEPEKPANDRQQ